MNRKSDRIRGVTSSDGYISKIKNICIVCSFKILALKAGRPLVRVAIYRRNN